MPKIERYWTILLLIATLLFSTQLSVVADEASDYVNISVNVSAVAMVDITPTSLYWTGVGPGNESAQTKNITIENIGSINVTHIWFNNTYPNSNPFGSGSNASYDAGNFVVLRRHPGAGVPADLQYYFFPNRVEYNQSDPLGYISVPAGWYYGRFRNSSYEYFWAIDASDGNCSDAIFRLGNSYHDQNNAGTTDFTPSGSDYTQYTLTPISYNGQVWGYVALNDIGGDANFDMCLAVDAGCTQFWFYKWNMDAPGASSCANARYFWNGTQEGNFAPGKAVLADVKVRVPYGVHWGKISGVLWVTVLTQ